jgi:tRNA G18 (ribose-2'-O)-methylase SpoU
MAAMAEFVPISDADDPRVAPYLALSDAQLRAAGLFVAESRLVLERLIASSLVIESLLVLDRQASTIAPLVESSSVPMFTANASVIEAVVGFNLHRGVLALGRRRAPIELAADASRIVVLDGLNDAENVGSIFRTAAALGWDHVLLTPGTVDPLHRRVVRVSMGAVLHMPWSISATIPADVRVAVLTPDGASTLHDVPRDAPLALVLGAEHTGVSQIMRARAGHTVRIDMNERVDSLSVTAAASIALHALRG